MLIFLLLVPPVFSEIHFLNDFFMIIWCGKNDDAEKGSLFRRDTTDWFSDSSTVQIKGISANNLCSNLLDRAKFECIRSSYTSGLLLRDDSAFHQRLDWIDAISSCHGNHLIGLQTANIKSTMNRRIRDTGLLRNTIDRVSTGDLLEPLAFFVKLIIFHALIIQRG